MVPAVGGDRVQPTCRGGVLLRSEPGDRLAQRAPVPRVRDRAPGPVHAAPEADHVLVEVLAECGHRALVLTRAPEVQALIQGELDRVNQKFARVEQIKKFWLLDMQLSAEDDELTPTMKLKRKLVEKKYAGQIESMYRASA